MEQKEFFPEELFNQSKTTSPSFIGVVETYIVACQIIYWEDTRI